MFSYAPLIATLHKKQINKTQLREAIGASSTTIAKISRDEYVSLKILDDICNYLNVGLEEVIVHVKGEDHQA
ncbi:helix-turn-helix domain-containing protein [Halalkalibacter flavus]|uniref:helix-turn-helix domain-containing protein n=1 Tax=Halalkalibacter flavus TaxID=3090668 RepID=UPI002FCB2FFC